MLSKTEIVKNWMLGMLFLMLSTSMLFAQDKAYTANEIHSLQATHLPGRGVQLSWSTKFNDTTAYFIVERSLDGMNFEILAEVNATNTRTNHKFIDRDPYKEVSYYRLQIIDYDGKGFTSNLISVYIPGQGQPELVLYPMPVGNSETLSLRFQGVAQSCKALVQVTDHAGRRVLSKEVDINYLQSQSELNFDGQLSPGNYQITVIGHSGASFKIGKLLQIVQ